MPWANAGHLGLRLPLVHPHHRHLVRQAHVRGLQLRHLRAHGGHHVAQKLSTTGVLRSAESSNRSPAVSTS